MYLFCPCSYSYCGCTTAQCVLYLHPLHSVLVWATRAMYVSSCLDSHAVLVTRSTIETGRGCNKLVPVLRGNGTKIAPTGDICVQPPGEMSWIRGKLTDHVGDHAVLSPGEVVLVTSSGTELSHPRPSQSLNNSCSATNTDMMRRSCHGLKAYVVGCLYPTCTGAIARLPVCTADREVGRHFWLTYTLLPVMTLHAFILL